MAADESAKKQTLLMDLQNIRDVTLSLMGEVGKDSFDWSEELYAQVRELRDRIVRL